MNDMGSAIKVKLLPRSSGNQFLGKEGDVYRISVTDPPVDGKANRALISLLSKKLEVPKRNIEIVSGKRSRIKRIRVHGISGDVISNMLENI
jgi:uncharacterized protein (TIGR00251 family)